MASASASVVGVSISRLLEESACTLYRVNEQEPIISAGLHLSHLDIEGVVATGPDGRPTGIIVGYNVLRLLNPGTVWSTFYSTRIADSKMRVLLARPEDDLHSIVRGILNHGWGYAIVVNKGGVPTNLVGLLDIAEFLVKSGFSAKVANVRAKEKASNPLIAIREGASVMEAVQRMLERHVRRLYVRESELVISDRGVIKWLLSPANLGRLRDAPNEILESPVRSMGPTLHRPTFVEADMDAASALKLISSQDARCLITRDRKMILTPWDLTIGLLAK